MGPARDSRPREQVAGRRGHTNDDRVACPCGSSAIDDDSVVIHDAIDDLAGWAALCALEALSRPQAHVLRIAASGRFGPKWPRGSVDLRVRAGSRRMVDHELVHQTARA